MLSPVSMMTVEPLTFVLNCGTGRLRFQAITVGLRMARENGRRG